MAQGSQRYQTIDAPHLLTGRQRARDTFATGAMWVLYAYLWLPAVSLGAWLLGIDFAYEVMVRAGGAVALRHVLTWYALALAIIIFVVTVWSAVERFRFRGKQRRQAAAAVADDALMKAFRVNDAQLRLLRQANTLQLAIDASGQLQGVRSGAEQKRIA